MTDDAGAPLTGWVRACAALDVLAADPQAVGGLWLRARAGPVRDRFLAALAARMPGIRRIHPGIGDDALYGGLDLTATLAAGRVVMAEGVLARPGPLLLTMAERCPPGLAARLAAALDDGAHALIVLDEGAGPDEGLPPALADRIGLFVALDGIPVAEAVPPPDPPSPAPARGGPATLPAAAAADLTRVAAALGIGSLRAPLLACAAARALAALNARDTAAPADLARAAELTLAHRASPPAEAETPDRPEPPPPPPDAPDDRDNAEPTDQDLRLPDEILLDAARAALPPDLLAQLAAGRAARAAKGARGSGAASKGNRRGRPLPSRAGRLDGRARIDLVATLRAAAPWQRLRRAETGRGALLELRADDIRLRRYRETSDRLLIFTVDASGSAALARLAEVKGAVELLLAAAYVRRDHVALIAFRGRGAELLLPPTRSLVQTKRRLSGLPGGGGTPLAAGLAAALELAALTRGRGMTPSIALLTDGRANIALDGAADRPAAEADALRLARAIRAAGLPGIVIDSGNRPTPALAALARAMDAAYLPLPRADAHRLSAIVSATISG